MKGEETRLFSVVPGDRTGDKGYKLKYRKFCLHKRKKLLHSVSEQTLEEVAQRGCGVSILGDTQKPTGDGPKQLGLGDPTLSKGVGLDSLQRSLPTSTLL